MATFTQFCDLNTVFFPNNYNYSIKPNIVYYGGYIYGGYGGGTDSSSSFIYRIDSTDTSNNVVLTNSKFYNISAIAVDSSGVYCFSPETSNKIYTCPLDLTSITDIDLSGTTIQSNITNNYYLCKTNTDFYIGYDTIVYKIPINTNEVSIFSNLTHLIICLQIDNDSDILYTILSDKSIYRINMTTGEVTNIATITNDYQYISNQMAIYDGNIYFNYMDYTSNEILVIYNILYNSFIYLLMNNIDSINPLAGITFNTDGTMYVREQNDSIIYKSTSILCFNEGTKILCLNQQLIDKYNRIELLRIGDFVKTYKHGYRKVNKVIQGSFKNNPKKWNMCMYKMAKTLTNGLTDDLIVTGGHSLLVDAISDEEQKKYDEMGIPSFSKLTIDNKHLLLSCCSDQFTAMQDTGRYNYYHLLLENNDDEEERFGIWANGILTETPNVKTVHD